MTMRSETQKTVARGAHARRDGFTLIETMVAVVLLVGVVLTMGMGTTVMSKQVSDSSGRSRGQALADMQIGRARGWPTYSTLSALSASAYNIAIGGLTPVTAVVVDSSGGQNITHVTVTVTGTTSSGLLKPIVRSISIAAP